MALYPAARQELIPPGPNDPRLDVVVGSIGHVAVSEASDLHDWFDGPSGGIESHFYIQRDGDVIQYRDTRYEADAQGAGNSWLVGSQRYGFVSYETQGMGEGEWTSEQLASIKALITWVNKTHGSPWQKTPSYHGRGHGYHSLFTQWNPNGHTCPGPDRIVQFNNIIVPWLNAGGKEYDVQLSDSIGGGFTVKDALNRIMGGVPAGSSAGRVDAGGLPARVLDTGDGGFILAAIHAAQEDPDAFADKIVAKLGVTSDAVAVKQAVKEALKEGVGS